MKKITHMILTILILTLTACSGANTSPSTSSQPNGGTAPELSTASKLVIGSFKLEETDVAITPEQAVELLPLWQVYQEISTSDTAAQAEIDALIEQVQETMSPEQMNAINEMNLTQQDVFALMQEQGIQFGGAQQGNQSGSQNNSGVPGGGPGFPGGAPPDGGGIPGGGFGGEQGQNLSPDQIATAQARRAENGGGGFGFNITPAPLIEAFIQFLQDKAGP